MLEASGDEDRGGVSLLIAAPSLPPPSSPLPSLPPPVPPHWVLQKRTFTKHSGQPPDSPSGPGCSFFGVDYEAFLLDDAQKLTIRERHINAVRHPKAFASVSAIAAK